MIFVKDVISNETLYINPEHVILAKAIIPFKIYELILTDNNKVNIDYNTLLEIRKVLE